MARLRLAILGFGRLGRACAHAVQDNAELELTGIVRRPGAPAKLPAPFGQVEVAAHLRDLGRVDVALLCVSSDAAGAVAHDVLQMRVSLVECAILEGSALEAHYGAIARATARITACARSSARAGIRGCCPCSRARSRCSCRAATRR